MDAAAVPGVLQMCCGCSSGFLKEFCCFQLISSPVPDGFFRVASCKLINFDLSDIKMLKDELADFN